MCERPVVLYLYMGAQSSARPEQANPEQSKSQAAYSLSNLRHLLRQILP